VLCLLVFSLQSYVAATHMHGIARGQLAFAGQSHSRGGATTATGSTDLPSQTDHNRVPVRDNDCPVCRVMVHAGAFLFPAFLIVELPGDGVVIARQAIVSQPTTSALSHSWSSRGPPRN